MLIFLNSLAKAALASYFSCIQQRNTVQLYGAQTIFTSLCLSFQLIILFSLFYSTGQCYLLFPLACPEKNAKNVGMEKLTHCTLLAEHQRQSQQLTAKVPGIFEIHICHKRAKKMQKEMNIKHMCQLDRTAVYWKCYSYLQYLSVS